MALVLKTSDVKASVGSNPTLSVGVTRYADSIEGGSIFTLSLYGLEISGRCDSRAGVNPPPYSRGVGQLGRPPALGAGCRRFKSCRSDSSYRRY